MACRFIPIEAHCQGCGRTSADCAARARLCYTGEPNVRTSSSSNVRPDRGRPGWRSADLSGRAASTLPGLGRHIARSSSPAGGARSAPENTFSRRATPRPSAQISGGAECRFRMGPKPGQPCSGSWDGNVVPTGPAVKEIGDRRPAPERSSYQFSGHNKMTTAAVAAKNNRNAEETNFAHSQ